MYGEVTFVYPQGDLVLHVLSIISLLVHGPRLSIPPPLSTIEREDKRAQTISSSHCSPVQPYTALLTLAL